ncbi:uncharacterized protein PV06_04085 [Exophiala oligosperma]|uniref:Amino acid transporter transmembrane domain-containing protein n=2 Tax=Chaetothyriales TaxID=34395 RepID=A0A0D2C7D2_9EURO|nr:uncharacterized protein PV06_04085 [Exophiala oligosperma]KAJ9637426.1 hypothetical protein H2204_004850 [Knufia peltigerae]KIW45722.1 hypothetical protein PV06_04085 [Exophiala oligosperma]
MDNPTTAEKSSPVVADILSPAQPIPDDGLKNFGEVRETREVFKAHVDGVEFRTVSWQRAAILFLKIQFAMSILAVPSALAALGAVGGALSIVGWGTLNAYTALLIGDFRHRHPECHTMVDMFGILWGRFGAEIVGFQLLLQQVLVAAAGTLSISTALNALSNHGACTVVFNLVAAVIVTFFSSVRTFSKLGWLTWFGFFTFFVAVFIFTVAVTQQDRPAAAPQEGPFDLGWRSISYPDFVTGMVATANLFLSESGSSMYIPIIAEMRKPSHYRKAIIVAGVVVTILYLTISLVIYRWCGVWLTTPVFGSAGTLFKKISYGVALPGLIIGNGIYQHVAAKYAFVRILRNSDHLQKNTVVHWSTWIGVNVSLGVLAFIMCECVPILNYLLGLAGTLCAAPFSLIYPVLLWMYDMKSIQTGKSHRVFYSLHVFIAVVGVYMVIGGTYSMIRQIISAFADGTIGGVFECADNSGTIAR